MMLVAPAGSMSTRSPVSSPATASLGPWMKARSWAEPPSVAGSASGGVVNSGSLPVLVAWPKVAASRRSGARLPSVPLGSGPT